MAPANDNGKVFRIHVSGGQNTLFMLVCVYGDKPEETLDKYLAHAAVLQRAPAEHIPTLDADAKGIDTFIKPIKKAPGYELVNRLKLHWADRNLIAPA